MSQQEQPSAYPSYAQMREGISCAHIQGDSSTTFVKPHYEGLSRPFTPYTYTEEAVPPPPPYLYQQFPHQPRRNIRYVITIAFLAILVVGLGTLEVFQVAGWNLLSHDLHRSLGSNQSSMTSDQHTSASHKSTPELTLTPETIKDDITLGCGVCNDPILTNINTITIDTTNLRLIWIVKLNNVSGSEQVDIFHDFNLQDPSGNIYEGTGNLNTVFILSAGQIMRETEIFSFLPRPGVSYTLTARLGGSGITFNPVQFAF